MIEKIDCIVIGAGVVGLAVARELAQSGQEVILLESEDAFGTITSARNSEVIHAGIYYPENSLKARLCVDGKKRLYAFCDSHGVEYKKTGKLIVATSDEQVNQLHTIKEKALKNGVDDLVFLTKEQVTEYEPHLSCEAALLSPSTGIIDTHGLMLALLGDAENDGAMLALNSPVTKAQVTDEGIVIATGGDDPMELCAKIVINAAGLNAVQLAHQIDGLNPDTIPPAFFCKGNYFSIAQRTPFSHLIYPVPEKAGLGVHLTLDLGGQARFGPDTEWVETENNTFDYQVDPSRCEGFYEAIRRYWPSLPDNSLQADYSGMRPKIVGPGDEAADFVIQDASEHGISGLINLYGIESPGLTSCLAIAAEVRNRLSL